MRSSWHEKPRRNRRHPDISFRLYPNKHPNLSDSCLLQQATLTRRRRNAVEIDLSSVNQTVQRLTAEMALLKAQQSKPARPSSPWLPLKEAASRLNFSSARSLRNRIKNGSFPPDCFRIDPAAPGRVTRYLVNVERYIKKLG